MGRVLPPIKRIGYDRVGGLTTASCWFENGAKLSFRETEADTVLMESFRSEDPHTEREAVEVGTLDDSRPDGTACDCLVKSLDVYEYYRSNDAIDELRTDWPEFCEAVAPDHDPLSLIAIDHELLAADGNVTAPHEEGGDSG